MNEAFLGERVKDLKSALGVEERSLGAVYISRCVFFCRGRSAYI